MSRQISEPTLRPHHTVVAQSQSLDSAISAAPVAPVIVEPDSATPTIVTPTSASPPRSAGLSPPPTSSNRLSVMSTASTTSVEVTPVGEWFCRQKPLPNAQIHSKPALIFFIKYCEYRTSLIRDPLPKIAVL
jgi:hypothetical protein